MRVHNKPPYRVVQWTTGNVGKSSVQAIAANPTLELVGCYAWSPEKVGRDVGELCGIDTAGRRRHQRHRRAARTQTGLRGLQPDVARCRRARAHPVSGCQRRGHRGLHHRTQPWSRPRPDHRGVPAGGSTMFGTGISPGFAELLAIVSATICDRVDKITVNEAADTTFYDSPATEIPVGFGKPIDHPDLQSMTAQGTAVFGEAVRMVADALGVELDDVRCEAEYAQTTADLDLGSWTIAAGCVAGVAASWKGIVHDRVDRRAQRSVAEGPDARARLEDRPGRVGDPDRRAADGDGQRSAFSAA